jgi:hypothetical protein
VTPKLRAWLLLVVVLVLCSLMVWGAVWYRSRTIAPVAMMKRLPTADALVLYVDFAELRRGGILKMLAGSKVGQDLDYQNFVRKTNFDFTSDLDAAMVAFAPDGNFMLLRGRWDWGALAGYAYAAEGKCNNTFCWMAGSAPERQISFFPLQRNLMALAVSADNQAAHRMQEIDTGPDPEGPTAPIWLSIPPSIGTSGRKLPDGTHMFASAVANALGVTLGIVPENGEFSARLNVRCRSVSDAVALASVLNADTEMARKQIAREGQNPTSGDFSLFITSGKFHNEGMRVLGVWPPQTGLVENLMGTK